MNESSVGETEDDRQLRRQRAVERRFEQRRRRQRFRTAAPFLVLATIAAVLVSGYIIIYHSSWMSVRDIQVSGNHIVSREQIQQATNLPAQTPLARVNTKQVRERLLALAPLEQVTVMRQWPDTVSIIVRERTPVAAVAQARSFLVVDQFGVFYQRVSALPKGLMKLSVPRAVTGDAALVSAIKVILALPTQLSQQVIMVSAPTPDQITLAIRGGRTVIWGDWQRSESKAKVALALLQHSGTRINVSSPNVVTVR